MVDQHDPGNHIEVRPVRTHATPVTYYPGQIAPGEDNPIPDDTHPQVWIQIQHYYQPLSVSEMCSIMKEAPDPVREGQEFIRFLRRHGRIFGFHAGDYDHIVRSLLPRAMFPTLAQGYRMLAWSSGREACDSATANVEI